MMTKVAIVLIITSAIFLLFIFAWVIFVKDPELRALCTNRGMQAIEIGGRSLVCVDGEGRLYTPRRPKP